MTGEVAGENSQEAEKEDIGEVFVARRVGGKWSILDGGILWIYNQLFLNPGHLWMSLQAHWPWKAIQSLTAVVRTP